MLNDLGAHARPPPSGLLVAVVALASCTLAGTSPLPQPTPESAGTPLAATPVPPTTTPTTPSLAVVLPSPAPPTSTLEPTATSAANRTPLAAPTVTSTVSPTPVVPMLTATPAIGLWKPPLSVEWQWMIDHALDVNNAKDMGLADPSGKVLPNAAPQVYDIDGFYNGQDPNCNVKDSSGKCVQGENDAVAQLHAMGKKVICYIDVGVYENYRPDAYKFPSSVIGSADSGWNGSYWLDVRQISVLGPIMKARMQMCHDKGYDAIEPDEIDGYSNDPGFPMTYQDQLT